MTLYLVNAKIYHCSLRWPAQLLSLAGILYKGGRQRTVLLKELEEDYAHERTAWRCSKHIRDRLPKMKRVIYYALGKAAAGGTSAEQVLVDLEARIRSGWKGQVQGLPCILGDLQCSNIVTDTCSFFSLESTLDTLEVDLANTQLNAMILQILHRIS